MTLWDAGEMGNTSTCVEKTTNQYLHLSEYGKHLHVRGEDNPLYKGIHQFSPITFPAALTLHSNQII
jgi:hypothetical protein